MRKEGLENHEAQICQYNVDTKENQECRFVAKKRQRGHQQSFISEMVEGQNGYVLADQFTLDASRFLIVVHLVGVPGSNHVSGRIELFEVCISLQRHNHEGQCDELEKEHITADQQSDWFEYLTGDEPIERLCFLEDFHSSGYYHLKIVLNILKKRNRKCARRIAHAVSTREIKNVNAASRDHACGRDSKSERGYLQ